MAYELKDGQGSLWPNKKRTKDTSPNSTGQIKINGRIYLLSGWAKETKNGVRWVSLSVREADETNQDNGDDEPF